MPPVYLKDRNGTIFYDNIVTLVSSETYITTTKPSSSGRWYYEVTHIEGDYGGGYGFYINNDNSHGFYIGQTQRSFFYIYKYDGVKVFSSSLENPVSNYDRIPLPNMSVGYTIGLGFDCFSRIFSVIYNNTVIRYTISSQSSSLVVTPSFLESTGIVRKDKISVNLGQKEFEYPIPFGYLPWKSAFYQCTSVTRTSLLLGPFFFSIIFS